MTMSDLDLALCMRKAAQRRLLVASGSRYALAACQLFAEGVLFVFGTTPNGEIDLRLSAAAKAAL